MKKGVAIILLLITLTAVFTPCCQPDDCEETTITMNEHPSNEAEDNCSPFVTCGYCSGFTQLNSTGEIPVITAVGIAHYSKEANWFSSTYSASLFQPPKSA